MNSAPARGTAGQLAERAVEQHLTAAGLTLLERNFRCRAGEIDLILAEAEVLVFVEVRLRQSERFGGALGSVGPAKQRRLYRAACAFLSSGNIAPQTPMRFDVVAVRRHSVQDYVFEWIRDAFQFD